MASSSLDPCPRCGARRRTAALGGLCPRCLLQSAGSPTDDAPVVAPSGPRFFGDYELLQELGRGGAGVVYRARDRALGRNVALKVLLSGEWASPDFVERFRTEATAAAALTHPHIVPVFDFGEIEGRHYLVMGLVSGGSLAERLRRPNAPLTPEQAARFVAKLARAVHHAHQRGVLHRDLKPANVLLDADQEPQLTDFGLAKWVAREGTLTQTHMVLGTPAYMSPEQAGGRTHEVTTGTDIYGLGAILYELLTGCPPFAGGTSAETVRHVLEDPPRRPRSLNPAVPKDLEVIALKCLEKAPQRRYGSAEALADELERWSRHEPILARPTPPWERLLQWTRRHPSIASLAAVLLLTVLTTGILIAGSNSRLRRAQTVIAAQAEERRQQLVQLSVNAGYEAWRAGDPGSALGHFVAALRLDSGDPRRERAQRERLQIVLSQLPEFESVATHTAPLRDAVLDPLGGRLAIGGTDGRVQMWSDAAGGPPHTLRHAAAVDSLRFNATGSRLLTLARDHRTRLWASDTGRLLAEVPAAPAFPSPLETPLRVATFSPDGSQWVLSGTNGLQIRSAEDGQMFVAIPGGMRVNDAAFSPDGTRLAWADEDGTLAVASVQDGTLLWRRQHHVGMRRVWWNPAGTRLIWADEAFRFCVASAEDGQDQFDPLNHRRLVLDATFDPDGQRFATASYDNTARVWDTDSGRAVTPWLRHEGAVRSIRYSGSGREVLTASDDGTAAVWDANTGEHSRPILRHGGPVPTALWLPQDAGVLTVSQDAQVRRWRWRPDHGAVRVWRRPAPAHRVFLFPDGRQSLQVWLDGMVRREPLDAGTAEPGFEYAGVGQAHDAWLSADGRKVLLLGADDHLRVCDAQTGEPLLGPWKANPRPWKPALNRDASRIAIARPGEELALYDGTTGHRIPAPTVPRVAGNSVRFSPDGRHLLAVDTEGVLHDLNPQDGTEPGAPLRMPGVTYTFQWAPDSRHLARITPAGIEMWDLQSGRPTGIQWPFPEPVLSVRFSPDGESVAVSSDHFVGVVSTRTGKPSFPPRRHAESVLSMDLDSEGRRILASTADGRVWLWETTTGEPAGPALPHEGYVVDATFSPDGLQVLTADNEGTIRLWDTSACAKSLNELESLARQWRGAP